MWTQQPSHYCIATTTIIVVAQDIVIITAGMTPQVITSRLGTAAIFQARNKATGPILKQKPEIVQDGRVEVWPLTCLALLKHALVLFCLVASNQKCSLCMRVIFICMSVGLSAVTLC